MKLGWGEGGRERGSDEVSFISSGIIERNSDERPLDVATERSPVTCERKD